MGCCGDKRRAISATAAEPVLFEYTGATAMTVIGPMTRRVYRFPLRGARVAVDRRDAPHMAATPNLRRVIPKASESQGVESAW